jgi:hypothetical protein
VKRRFWLATLIALSLTACSPVDTDVECRQGVCISLNINDPVQALEPTRFAITVRTDTDVAGLGVGIFVGPGVKVQDVDTSPGNAIVAYQDDRSLDWLMDTAAGVEYTFTGHLELIMPTVTYGISSYDVVAYVNQPTLTRVVDNVVIYLHPDGSEADATEVEEYRESTLIAPSAPPDLTIVPMTPFPSITPYPPTLAASATVPGYPGPVTTTPYPPTQAPSASAPAYPGPGDASPTAQTASTQALSTATAAP